MYEKLYISIKIILVAQMREEILRSPQMQNNTK